MANHKRDKINSLSRNSPFPFTSILSPGGRGKGEGVSSERGVALIAAVLAVTILMVIGLSFAFNMRLEEKAAVNFMNNVRAKQIAQAGIERAIAELRNDAYPYGGFSFAVTEHDQFGDAWNSVSGSIDFGEDITGNYTVTVVDTARRIHLNDFDSGAALGTVLENLVAALRTAEAVVLDDGDGTSIYDNRPARAEGGYITSSQITVVTGSTITATEYRALSNYITSEGYLNPNRFWGSSAVNINTADQYTLQAIFQAISSVDRDTIVQAILEYRAGKKYNTDYDGIVGNNDRWVLLGGVSPDVGAGNANPFDGIDTNRGDGIDPTVTGFHNDNLDNDGDGRVDETEVDENLDYDGDGISALDFVEGFMFAGGARGEFNALIDYIRNTVYGSGAFGTIGSDAVRDQVKNNADPAQTPTTVGLAFESKFFAITSTGTITRGGEQLAESKIVQIVERER